MTARGYRVTVRQLHEELDEVRDELEELRGRLLPVLADIAGLLEGRGQLRPVLRLVEDDGE